MRRFYLPLPTLAALTLLACAPEVVARREALEGGRALAACDWPSVGMIDSSCTATLIDSRWILTAAHCPTGSRFAVGSLSAGITRCIRHPDFDSSGRVYDFMVCELDRALDVPTVPLLAPCEAAQLHTADEPRALPVGRPVLVIGLGQPAVGTKRAVDMEVSSFIYSSPLIDFRDPLDLGGSRPGDSGGPTFLALEDGTWRQVGVHHEGGVGSSVLDAFVTAAVPWIETTSSVDTTPCHVGDAWMRGAACADLPSDLEGGGGTFPACSVVRTAPTPTCVATADAGTAADAATPDAATTGLDAGGGTTTTDAGARSDAGAAPDASAAADAGAGSRSDGCGCSVASRSTPLLPSLAIAALAVLRRLRARRRRATLR